MQILVFLGIISFAAGGKILIISPLPIYSHQSAIFALTKGLLARGHNITILTTYPIKKSFENYTEVDISFSHKVRSNSSLSEFHQKKSLGTLHSAIRFIHYIVDFYYQLSVIQYESPVVKEFIRSIHNERFDLIITESATLTGYLAISHIIKAPVITVTTMSSWSLYAQPVGNPSNPSFVPSVILPYGDYMSLLERITNTFVTNYVYYIYNWKMIPDQDYLSRKYFGKDIPPIGKLESITSLQLIFVSPILSYPQPRVPCIIHVGPLHIEQPNPLPTELKTWIEGAKEGVIYFSLGSNFQGVSLPESIREAFISSFAEFPDVRFLWKWESDAFFPGQTQNVRFMKWIPQQDILAHPNIRCFITQVGIQSLQEAVHYGVPIIGVPLYIDQLYNMRKILSVGAGIKLDFADISKETVSNSLTKIISDKSYKVNMLKLSKLMKDEPKSPMDTATWWVEYVIRNKGTPFRVASLDLPWYQYFLIDIVFYILVTFLLVAYSIFKLIKIIKQFVCTRVLVAKCNKIE